MAEIELVGKLARGRSMQVDAADLDWLGRYPWRVLESIRPNGTRCGPYARTTIPTGRRGGDVVMAHAMITGYRRTDHWDGNGLNNTRRNLRDATQSQNMANRGANRNGSSPYKGVCLHRPSGLWMARITVNRRDYYLGYFRDDADAARAYDRAADEAWGSFARLNFPATRV